MTASEVSRHDTERSGRGHLRAIGWSFFSDGSRILSGLGVVFLVAAMVGREEFGEVTLAIQFIILAELVQKQGLEAAIIQRPILTEPEVRSAFWLLNGFSIATALVMFVLAPFLADLNDAPAIENQLRALCLVLVLRGVSLVPDALLRREMRFRELGLRTSATILIASVVAVVMALAGAGAWALVVQQLLIAGLDSVLVWRITTWRPSRGITRQAVRSLLGFSAGTFLASLTTFVYLRIETPVMGAVLGIAAVGVFQAASRLIDQGVTIAVTGIQAVSLPALSALHDDRQGFLLRFEWFLRIIAMVGAAVAGVGAIVAPDIAALLGEDFEAAVPAIRVLCITALFRPLGLMVTPTLQATGKPFRLAALTLYAALGAIAAVAIGLPLGVGQSVEHKALIVAFVRLAIEVLVMAPLSLAFLHRYADVPIRRALSPVGYGMIMGSLIFGAASAVRWTTGDLVESSLLRVAIWGSIGSVIAGVVVVATDSTIRALLLDKLAEKRPAGRSARETTT